MNEQWLPISELGDIYEVSDRGNVRSTERIVNNRTYPSRMLKPKMSRNCLMVRLHKNGYQINRSVAKLVLMSFVGHPPLGSRNVIHIDGDPYNNVLENLKWNVRKSFYLPYNEAARTLFYEKAEFYVREYIKLKKLYKFCRLGCIDEDDICNEALLRIWLDIDSYDSRKITFKVFCFRRTKDMFLKMYSKESRKKQCISSLAIDNVDYIKELSYERDFFH